MKYICVIIILVGNLAFGSRVEKPRKLRYLDIETAEPYSSQGGQRAFHSRRVNRKKNTTINRSVDSKEGTTGKKSYKKFSPGNLPSYSKISNKSIVVAQNTIKRPSKDVKFNDTGIYLGDLLDISIKSDIIGHRKEKLPVTAEVNSGNFFGAKVFGYSTIDSQTKRLRVMFTHLISSNGDKYKLLGEISDKNNLIGVKGKIDSKFWPYFGAYLLANAVGDYTASRVQTTNSFSGPVPKISTENAIKQGTGGAIKKSSNMLVERLKNYPEIVKVIGPLRARILITEEPNKI